MLCYKFHYKFLYKNTNVHVPLQLKEKKYIMD